MLGPSGAPSPFPAASPPAPAGPEPATPPPSGRTRPVGREISLAAPKGGERAGGWGSGVGSPVSPGAARAAARPAPSSKAPPSPARLRPLLASPPAPGDRRRHPVGGFPCPGSGARRRPGPGEGEEKEEGRGVDGRQGRRLRGGELVGEENVRLGGALGGGGGARRT